MVTEQQEMREADFTLLVDFATQTGNVNRLIQAVELMGPEKLWAALSPQMREQLLLLAAHDKPGEASDPR